MELSGVFGKTEKKNINVLIVVLMREKILWGIVQYAGYPKKLWKNGRNMEATRLSRKPIRMEYTEAV